MKKKIVTFMYEIYQNYLSNIRLIARDDKLICHQNIAAPPKVKTNFTTMVLITSVQLVTFDLHTKRPSKQCFTNN